MNQGIETVGNNSGIIKNENRKHQNPTAAKSSGNMNETAL